MGGFIGHPHIQNEILVNDTSKHKNVEAHEILRFKKIHI